MKNISKYGFAAITALALNSCRDGYLDKINNVAAGTDSAAPTVTIVSPSNDVALPASQSSTDFTFSYSAMDDVELSKVVITLDGTQLASYDSFLDYRNFANKYTKNIGLGNHTFKVDATDAAGKTTSKSYSFNVSKYNPVLASESLYVPFGTNDYKDLIKLTDATLTGAPATVSGKKGLAYQGKADSYISYPVAGLFNDKNTEMSLSFWYKVNPSQERAGIVVVGNPAVYASSTDNSRKYGFRLFREGTTGIKINAGYGDGESWNTNAKLPDTTSWAFITMTIAGNTTNIYINGVLASSATMPGNINFSGCTNMSVGSGLPTFDYWGHKEDTSLIDEFKVYNKALTPAEVLTEMNN